MMAWILLWMALSRSFLLRMISSTMRRVRRELALVPTAVDLAFTAATMAAKSCFRYLDAFFIL